MKTRRSGINENQKVTLTLGQLRRLVWESLNEGLSDNRKERIRKRVEQAVSNIANGAHADKEWRTTLEYGNSWSPELDLFQVLAQCYRYKQNFSDFPEYSFASMEFPGYGFPPGKITKSKLVEIMTDIVYKSGKDYPERTEDTIYLYTFEAEHDGDVNGVRRELEDAGASIVDIKGDFLSGTGYAMFTVKNENVDRFEREMGCLYHFKTVKR